ncbi:hypothetical protein SLEP1_g32976 [Rubroshorea leprosula]|uniref:Uncharacterized protein n=1 Tax=Rubroshorea leprosula TaxID=152421 RepID=A0AAV5KFB9_9ROSI|nr:hypothetical protein SLEP1_g32976 [Rubroshorea leprosula]
MQSLSSPPLSNSLVPFSTSLMAFIMRYGLSTVCLLFEPG